ncbi:unnamed protein product [Phytophthora lilii]|uniref:Unnamed protein product n=1 Tax=Phytophthora lilii TaxID=2077276 RepID=A0A9W6X1D7_9STRA|nr:unnamed protein product [Phytophthora lilii]
MIIVISSLVIAFYAASFDLSRYMFKNPDCIYDPEFMSTLVLKTELIFASVIPLSAKATTDNSDNSIRIYLAGVNTIVKVVFFVSGERLSLEYIYELFVSQDEHTFNQLSASALATLTVSHCPALRLPSSIKQFIGLMMFYVYNSTVVDWDDASSISATVHRRLFALGITRSSFPSGFPKALLQPLPPSLISIQFCVTDIASIPDDLPALLHPLATAGFEYGVAYRRSCVIVVA